MLLTTLKPISGKLYQMYVLQTSSSGPFDRIGVGVLASLSPNRYFAPDALVMHIRTINNGTYIHYKFLVCETGRELDVTILKEQKNRITFEQMI